MAGKEHLKYSDDITNSLIKCRNLNLNTFSEKSELLYHENHLVIPKEVECDVIKSMYSCGHFSTNKTKEMILRSYWCPKLHRKVKQVVDSCSCKCQKSYGHNPLPSKFPYEKIQNFEVVCVDLVSLPSSRSMNYLLTMIDLKSRLLSAIPISNVSASNVASIFFKEWICRYGPPAIIPSDQGQQFTSQLLNCLCENYSIRATKSSIYHPKGNSVIERAHRTLKDRLRCMPGYWTNNIHEAVYNCNRASGAFLQVYQRTGVPKCDWPVPSDFLKQKVSLSGPQVGDYVAIRQRRPTSTLSPRFHGKFKVKERYGSSVVLGDNRKVNLHDCILVGKSEANVIAQ